MYCSNCGKDIPFSGNVCPYCNVDKSEDRFSVFASWVGGLPGAMVGGALFFSHYHRLSLAFLGMALGGVLGILAIYRLRGFLPSVFRTIFRSRPTASPYRKTHDPKRGKN